MAKEIYNKKIMRNITVSAKTIPQFEAVARAGFFGVDLSLAGYDRREELLSGAYEKELMSRYNALTELGLTVGQTHLAYWPSHIAPAGDGSYEAQAEFILPMLQREIELTARLGCRVAVTHPFFVQNGEREESRSGNMRMIEALMPTLEQYGVTLALENIYGRNYSDAHHERPQDLIYYAQRFDSDHLGICLDTGHAYIRDQDPTDMAREYGEYLKALHVHTPLAHRDSHAIPCTTLGDPIKWYDFCEALDDIGFSGNFNLEIRPNSKLPLSAQDAYYRLAYEVAKDMLQTAMEKTV